MQVAFTILIELLFSKHLNRKLYVENFHFACRCDAILNGINLSPKKEKKELSG